MPQSRLPAGRRQEFRQHPVENLRIVEIGDMPRLQNDAARVGRLGDDIGGLFTDRRGVVQRVDDQARAADAVQIQRPAFDDGTISRDDGIRRQRS